jgi:hypothetical protein
MQELSLNPALISATIEELLSHLQLNYNKLQDHINSRLYDSDWVEPTLVNSWVSYDSTYGPPGYRKIAGMVYLKGLIKSGTLSTVIFTLPVGFRPSASVTPSRYFLASGNGGITYVEINGVNGEVSLDPGDATWTNLNGIVFPAES